MEPAVGDRVRLASPVDRENVGPSEDYYGGEPRTETITSYPAGSIASGKVGEVMDLSSHPYGIEYGPVYLIRIGMKEVWVGPEMIEEIL